MRDWDKGWFRWWVVLGVLVVVIAAYVGTSVYTSRPAFCNTCHEMTPYYSEWQNGSHAGVSCIRCHVDPGFIADLAHKPAALYEVWVHFTGDPTFPMTGVPLPDSRCLGCHPGTIDPGIEHFDHEVHRNEQACKTCHETAGHAVTAEALSSAGILNSTVQAQRDARTIAYGAGTSLAGHRIVPCSDCHDMAAAACVACHEPPAGHADGACENCHALGEEWAFTHSSASDCASCHTPPRNHYGDTCSACHTPTEAWDSATFEHPRIGGEHSSRSFACILCHPTGPPAVNCTCHGGSAPHDD